MYDFDLYTSVDGFTAGDRVEIQPYLDAWMMGDRYGDIVKIGRSKLHVRMDRSGRTLRITARQVARKITVGA